MIGPYSLIAALFFSFLYFALRKPILNIDEKALLEPTKSDIYPKFCDIIDERIREFKDGVQNNSFTLKDQDKKDELLKKLGDLNREPTFIQTMNLSNKSGSARQSELFDFSKEPEKLLPEYLEDGEKEVENLRENLANEFGRLRG